MLARTALGAVRVGAAGPERHARGAEGLRRAQHGADVAGVATPCRYTHSGPAGATPALLVDADHARPRAERRGARERGALHVVEVLARRDPSPPGDSPRPPPPAAWAAAAIRSSPSARKRAACARARAWCAGGARAFRRGFCWDAIWLICWVLGVCCTWFGTKKGAVPFRSDAREAVESIAGSRPGRGQAAATPRGRPRQNVGRCRRRARRCPRAPCGRARRRPASGRA